MAVALARRLRRLAAMRDAAATLMDRPQLGQDVFAAGRAEGLPVHEEALHESTLHELLRAYAAHRIRREPRRLLIELSAYHAMEDAYRRMSQLLGSTPDWETLGALLAPRHCCRKRRDGPLRRGEHTGCISGARARGPPADSPIGGRFGPIYLRRRREETMTTDPLETSPSVEPTEGRRARGPRLPHCGGRDLRSGPARRCRHFGGAVAGRHRCTKRGSPGSAAHYQHRGVHLVKVAGGWTFRTAPDLAEHLTVHRVVRRRLSRAALETLAIIAYHQPVTRAEV